MYSGHVCVQGHQISAIAWNRQNTSDTSTGEILLGTTKGMYVHVYWLMTSALSLPGCTVLTIGSFHWLKTMCGQSNRSLWDPSVLVLLEEAFICGEYLIQSSR